MVKSRPSFTVLLSILFLTAILTGCSSPVVTDTAIPPTQTAVPSTDTPVPSTETQIPTLTSTMTATLLPPTATFEPTFTPTSFPTDTPTFTPSATLAPGGAQLPMASGRMVSMYYIRVVPGETKGCSGTAVAVSSGVTKTDDIAQDVEAALRVLFSYREKYYGELYNPLYQSSLRVDEVKFDDGLITVQLRGTYKRTSDKCENTYVKAQVWSTIRQYNAVKATNIYLNRVPFGDLVSNDG
jgi:hypothetical protein